MILNASALHEARVWAAVIERGQQPGRERQAPGQLLVAYRKMSCAHEFADGAL